MSAAAGYHTWLPAGTLLWREVRRFFRQRNRLIGAIATPLVFWFLIGSGLGPSFQLPNAPEGMVYLEYFYPGALLLMVLFTAIFSTISIIEDRREGFLQSVLAAPVSPLGITLGKLAGGSMLAFSQGLLFLALAPAVGIPVSVASLLAAAGVIFLIGFGLTGLGFIMAWPMDSTQGYHALMNVFLMPLWLLSGALFPVSQPGSWVYWVAMANPMTYMNALLRRAFYGHDAGVENLPGLGLSLGVTIGFGLLMLFLGVRLVSKRRGRF